MELPKVTDSNAKLGVSPLWSTYIGERRKTFVWDKNEWLLGTL
jgi:hypothetical protein